MTAETTLRRVWAEVLKVEHVGPLDNFFDLGGDSILVLQMLARAREVGIDLGTGRLGEFLEDATCTRLLELTGRAEQPAPGPPADGESAPGVTAVVLRRGDAARTIFVLLPTMHDLWAVRELSARIDEASIHVLVPAWSPSRPYVSVARLGEDIAASIRAILPHGPYRLIGSCTAGQAAMEAASHLSSAGSAVDLLALVDTRAPARRKSPRSLVGLMPGGRGSLVELGSLIPKLLWLDRARSSLSPDELMLHLWTAVSLHVGDLMKYLTDVEPDQWDEAFRDRAARTFMTWLNFQLACEAYETPPRYAGRVTFVYGQHPRAECGDPAGTVESWKALTGCTGDLELFDEEEHTSAIMTNSVLARLIDRSLRSSALAG
jgi:aryl carrier-like protein